MSRQFFIILLLLAFSFGTPAQRSVERQVEKIRGIYGEISRSIEAAEKTADSGITSKLAVNELVVNKLNRSWAAVGTYRVVYRFYYQNKAEEPYPTELVKVTRQGIVAARSYYEEFVYGKSGIPIFYFEKSEDGEPPLERRIYFHNGKAIRIVEDKLIQNRFAGKHKAMVRGVLKRSRKIKQIFINSIEE
jgi:hypothetical protein